MVIVAVGLGVAAFTNQSQKEKTEISAENSSYGIKFTGGTLEEAKALAKKEKKIIFIDAYASWCGPCKMLDKNTFSDKSVGTYFNDKFINLKIDCEKHADGKMVARTYSVTAYPTLIWIDAEGNLIKKEIGYKTPEQLLKAVKDLK